MVIFVCYQARKALRLIALLLAIEHIYNDYILCCNTWDVGRTRITSQDTSYFQLIRVFFPSTKCL